MELRLEISQADKPRFGWPVYIVSPAEVRFIGQRLRYFGVGQFLEKRFVGVL